MNEFIPAKELKKTFQVYGSFYDINTSTNDIVKCRNKLEIFNKNMFTDLENDFSIYTHKPDALAIMMNPGSSKPSSKLNNYSEPLYEITNLVDNIYNNEMVIAKPDTTQYQIMRVMSNQNWSHVRVLNLSDIREPKCNLFLKKVRDFETHYGPMHSIFSEERIKERKEAFSIKENNPILLVWGCNKSLCNLADRAVEKIGSKKVIGIPYNITNLYRHPLPSLHKSKIEWLEKITETMNKKQ